MVYLGLNTVNSLEGHLRTAMLATFVASLRWNSSRSPGFGLPMRVPSLLVIGNGPLCLGIAPNIFSFSKSQHTSIPPADMVINSLPLALNCNHAERATLSTL